MLKTFNPAGNIMNSTEINRAIIDAFLDEQRRNWPLFAANSNNLLKVKLRRVDFEKHHVLLQFNPERIRSTAAKTDELSIARRPCFLCEKNRPPEQGFLSLENEYLILCNPYPIFTSHLTIVHRHHIPQRIEEHFPLMLRLASSLPHLVIFYNGPECGASAPDHFHLQAGEKFTMPMDAEYPALKKEVGETIYSDNSSKVYSIDDRTRKFLAIESSDPNQINILRDRIYRALMPDTAASNEPMLNIHCLFENGIYRTIIIPRKQHRPAEYFETGEKNRTISPASVDLGGLVITPVQRDFENISKEDISSIFRQVCIDEEQWRKLLQNFNSSNK
jgi:hypothetical protein